MRVLVLGAGGMLGHKMCMTLNKDHEVFSATRSAWDQYIKFDLFKKEQHIDDLDVLNSNYLLKILNMIQPEVVVNCIGMTTRKISESSSDMVIEINSVLPHKLAQWCEVHRAKLFHFSTDCVFSGQKGNYSEDDLTDARDLYGLSKILGEVNFDNSLTIRSSIIGREIKHKTELVEWFLSQKNTSVKGYSQAFYTGVTTNYMSRFVKFIIENHFDFSGIYQLASPKISKFELLQKINESLGLNIHLSEESSYKIDKSLVDNKLRSHLKLAEEPLWDTMIEDLRSENDLYEKWSES